MNVNEALHQAHLRFQRQSGALTPDFRKSHVDKNGIVIRSDRFVEPTTDTWIKQHRQWRPEGFYRLHCSHDRPLWVTCTTCKRHSKEAKDNFVRLLTGKLC